jgi:hypothetical protein
MGDDPAKPTDVVFLQGPTDDGQGVRVVRAREDRLETGEVRPLKEGQPLVGGEVVQLAPRDGAPRLCDVRVLARLGEAEGRSDGKPAQVATSAYRESWDRIFGAPPKREHSLN